MFRLIILQLLLFYIYLIVGQQFGFPEQGDEDKNKQNANNRKPIYLPNRCRENELLYPGDQKDDWVCDCSPGHIFYPQTDKCYLAFRKGPCPDGSILILPKNKFIPQCVTNVCNVDGQIRIRNKCYKFGEAGPCPSPELSNVVGVNITTLEVTCVKQSVDISDRIENEEKPFNINLDDVPNCPTGCKRYINMTCPVKLKKTVV